MREIIIAVDAMGGDHGPSVTVPAAFQAIAKHPNLKLILIGRSEVLNEKIAGFSTKVSQEQKDRIIVKHATEQVMMDESPTKALRTKKDSSMRVAINLVKDGTAHACVSAGNTGALVATAHFVLKVLPGVDRPAIITAFPTVNPDKEVRVLDLGANVDASSEYLYQFAIMGSVLTAQVTNIENPKVGLLNIGSEDIKGNEQVKKASQLLSGNKDINYIGYVEGDDIFKGNVDVVVCDGFIGNAVLKSIEGLAKLIGHYVKRAFAKNLFTKLITLLAWPILKDLSKQLDPGRRNGATLIGLRGTVIKSHGGANSAAFANAIDEAFLEVEKNVSQHIRDEVVKLLNSQ